MRAIQLVVQEALRRCDSPRSFDVHSPRNHDLKAALQDPVGGQGSKVSDLNFDGDRVTLINTLKL